MYCCYNDCNLFIEIIYCRKLILRISAQELTNGKKKVRIELQQNPQMNIAELQKSILNNNLVMAASLNKNISQIPKKKI